MLKQTSLGLGNLYLPDINTTIAPVLFSSQGATPHIHTSILDLHDEISPGFTFSTPAKRGRPKGSKTKKNVAKIAVAQLEQTKGGRSFSFKDKKRGASLIAVDPLEGTIDSSRTGKRSKGDEVVVPDIISGIHDEAVDAELHHRQEK